MASAPRRNTDAGSFRYTSRTRDEDLPILRQPMKCSCFDMRLHLAGQSPKGRGLDRSFPQFAMEGSHHLRLPQRRTSHVIGCGQSANPVRARILKVQPNQVTRIEVNHLSRSWLTMSVASVPREAPSGGEGKSACTVDLRRTVSTAAASRARSSQSTARAPLPIPRRKRPAEPTGQSPGAAREWKSSSCDSLCHIGRSESTCPAVLPRKLCSVHRSLIAIGVSGIPRMPALTC